MIVNFFRNKKTVNSIKSSMDLLLDFSGSDFIEKNWKDYPKIEASVIERSRAGEDSLLIAANTLLIIFTDLIEKCSDSQRGQLLENSIGDDTKLSEIDSKIKIFICSLYRQVKLGNIRENQYDLALRHIVDACKGKNSEERYRDGIINAIDKAFLNEEKI